MAKGDLEETVIRTLERDLNKEVRNKKNELIKTYLSTIGEKEGEKLSDTEALETMREIGKNLHLRELNIGADDSRVYDKIREKISDSKAESYAREYLGDEYQIVLRGLKSGDATETEIKGRVETRLRDYLKEEIIRAEASDIRTKPSDWINRYQKEFAKQLKKGAGLEGDIRFELMTPEQVPRTAESYQDSIKRYADVLMHPEKKANAGSSHSKYAHK